MNSRAECRDVMDYSFFPEYDILYCDPPWEDHMVKFFDTTYQKENGKEPVKHSISDLINKLTSLAYRNRPLFIEYSVKGHEAVVEQAVRAGHQLGYVARMLQTNNKEYVILVFNTPYFLPPGKGFEPLMGLVRQHVKEKGSCVVFDPFAGIGNTAKAVLKVGGIYVGSEFSPARARRLMEIVSKYGR